MFIICRLEIRIGLAVGAGVRKVFGKWQTTLGIYKKRGEQHDNYMEADDDYYDEDFFGYNCKLSSKGVEL